jgi:hypothetical protein
MRMKRVDGVARETMPSSGVLIMSEVNAGRPKDSWPQVHSLQIAIDFGVG